MTVKTPLQLEMERQMKELSPDVRNVMEIQLAHSNANHSNIMKRLDNLEDKVNPVFEFYSNMNFTGRLMMKSLAWVLGTIIAIGSVYQLIKSLFTK